MNDDDRLTLTASALKKFSYCPRAYYWRYIRGMSSKYTPYYLEIGSHFHEGLEKGFDDEEYDFPDDENGKQAKFMLDMYEQYYGDQAYFDEFKVEPEVEWKIDDWRDDVILAGKTDGIIYKPNGIYLLETKTTSRISESYLDKARLSVQISLYCWALSRILGERVKGVIFNVVSRPRKYRRKGEGIDDYLDRCAPEYLSSGPSYFARPQAIRGDREHREMEEDLHQFVETIKQYEKDEYFHKESTWCFDRDRPCDYSDLCLNGVSPRTLSKFEKVKPHRELTVV